MGFSHTPESKQVTAAVPYTFPQNQKIQNVKNIMVSILWDRKGILLVDFMPPGATINAAAYFDTLTRLRRAIQNKRRGMLSRGVPASRQYAAPFRAHHHCTSGKIQVEYIGPSAIQSRPRAQRFPLVSSPKKSLAGKRFDDDELQEEVMTWLNFYDSGIQKLVPRLKKCLDNASDYVKK
jgi:hypothetical protein